MGTPRKINAILLNIKINQRKLANVCRYKLATYWQNFMEICSTGVKILQEVLGGRTFLDSHCRWRVGDTVATELLKINPDFALSTNMVP